MNAVRGESEKTLDEPKEATRKKKQVKKKHQEDEYMDSLQFWVV